jgi:photosystem II stability/assembly factor-like uncharacterized protein
MRHPKALALLLTGLAAVLLALPALAPAAVSVGQSGWSWGSPLPQGNTIHDVEFAGDRGYAAGDFGTLLRTDDAGATWSGIATGITADLQRVRLLGPDSLIIGGGCSMRRSDDGGKTFRRLPFSASDVRCPAPVSSFAFPGPDVGYLALADGTVLRTDDGGKSFSRRTAVPGTKATGAEASPTDVAFTSADIGVAVTTAGRVYRTTDGGGSWTLVFTGNSPLRNVSFVDASNGFAVGDSGTLLVSTDGGQGWTSRSQTVGDAAPDLTAIHCADAQTCLMATGKGDQLLRTTDAGKTSRSVSPSTDAIFTAAFANPNRVVAAGAAGTTVVSNDGGVTYSPVGGRLADRYTGLRAVSATVAYAFGPHGALARTADGGQTWSAESVSTSEDVIDVSFAGDQTGYALDSSGSLLRTDNGGGSWRIENTGTQSVPRGVLALGGDKVLLAGPRGLRRSTNGGDEFAAVKSKVVKAAFLDGADRVPGAVFAWGPKALAVSRDGGATWKKVPRPTRTPLFSVDFVSTNTGFAVDTGSRVWQTTNRGRHWTELLGVGANGVAQAAFPAARDGYLALRGFGGENGGFILHTSDGGRTWRPQLVSGQAFDGLAASGATAFGLVGSLGSGQTAPTGLFATATGGDAGRVSHLTITPSKRHLGRAGAVRINGRLSPAEGGEQVQVSMRATGGRWVSVVTTAASNGTFTVTRRITKTTVFVAQWRGDDDRAGAGTAALVVKVGR